ncbi:DUF4192 family protein [Amnibacterium sp.]|uniref:DUF4192 family protein n=1 Tax=Amnibacterium sp. TaxID=1872496 RepID=UPI002604E736|nr:DUF4192 family protein [Amnibacterium sp.]MCU1474702.1 hypothetical protein [Amnibacterium sp.]
MTEIVRAARPVDLLRLVPRLVGFAPTESLVLVAFTRERTGSAMRVDLPATDDPAVLDAIARHLIGLLCRIDGVDGLIPVVYTAAPFAAAQDRLVQLLVRHAAAAGLVVKDAFCVGADGWGHLPGGRRQPLAELGPDAPDLLDPAAELRIPDPGPAARAAFREALAAWRTRPAGPGGPVHGYLPGAGLEGAGFRRGEPFLVRAARGFDTGPLIEGMLTPHDDSGDPCPCLAAFAAFADVPALAEQLLLAIAWGPAFGDRVRASWLERDEDDAVAQAALDGGELGRPDVPRIEAGLRAVRAALAHLEPAERAPLAACAAWLHWALGRGSLAGGFVDLALETEPRHPLALHLAARLRRGELPEWAFRTQPGLSLEQQVRRIA